MGMPVVKVVANFVEAVKTMELLPVDRVPVMEDQPSEPEPESQPQPQSQSQSRPRLTPVVEIASKPRPVPKKKSPALFEPDSDDMLISPQEAPPVRPRTAPRKGKGRASVAISPAIVLEDDDEEVTAPPLSQPRRQGSSTRSSVSGARSREREGPRRYDFSGLEVEEDSIIDNTIFPEVTDKVNRSSIWQRCR